MRAPSSQGRRREHRRTRLMASRLVCPISESFGIGSPDRSPHRLCSGFVLAWLQSPSHSKLSSQSTGSVLSVTRLSTKLIIGHLMISTAERMEKACFFRLGESSYRLDHSACLFLIVIALLPPHSLIPVGYKLPSLLVAILVFFWQDVDQSIKTLQVSPQSSRSYTLNTVRLIFFGSALY
jgi:hypothetical protein